MQSDDLPEILNKINLATMSGAKQQIAKEHSITKFHSHKITLWELDEGMSIWIHASHIWKCYPNVDLPLERWILRSQSQQQRLCDTGGHMGDHWANQSRQFIQGSAGCFLTFIRIKHPSSLKHMHFGSTTSHRYYSRTDSRTTCITNMQWNSSKSSIPV